MDEDEVAVSRRRLLQSGGAGLATAALVELQAGGAQAAATPTPHGHEVSENVTSTPCGPLSVADARRFFGSLFDDPTVADPNNFDAVATRFIARQGNDVVVGDQALQALMIAFGTSDPALSAHTQPISAALAGIKQRAVDAFLETFPNENLDSVIAVAQAAGYDIQVLPVACPPHKT